MGFAASSLFYISVSKFACNHYMHCMFPGNWLVFYSKNVIGLLHKDNQQQDDEFLKTN